MTTIKAIETRYKGYRFRSRLEARWAVFFDALGMKWEYEVQGYRLDNHTCYLPDFFVNNRCYVEIKGVATERDKRLCRQFAEAIGTTTFLCENMPGDTAYICLLKEHGWIWRKVVLYYCKDCQKMTWATSVNKACTTCPVCGKSIEFPHYALESARSARFEHGETP